MKSMRIFRSVLPLASLALAACSAEGDAPAAPDTGETPIPVEPDGGIGDGARAPAEVSASTIPEAMRGRWGLAPADCTSPRGDAKGSIEIDGTSIRFYESRAILQTIAESGPAHLHAQFAFSGEGQQWTRDMRWRLARDGMQLVRSEAGDGAIAEPLTYARCEIEGEMS